MSNVKVFFRGIGMVKIKGGERFAVSTNATLPALVIDGLLFELLAALSIVFDHTGLTIRLFCPCIAFPIETV